MSATRTPPRLSAWRDAFDARAHGAYSALPASLRSRARRLAYALLPVLQCGFAAGFAWLLTHDVIGHERPFFAPIAAMIALGTGMGKRIRRGVELVVGVVIGVGMGDLLISVIGSGTWQIVLVVVLAMSVAVFLDAGALVATQAASSAILVATLLPPGSSGGFERMIDTAVGGVVALVALALVPVNPVRRARREGAALLGVASAVLRQVALGLEQRDSDVIREALQQARDTQPAIDGLHEGAGGARELVRISPIFRRHRTEVDDLERILHPLDNAIRNIRVLARRAIVAVDDSVGIPDALVAQVSSLGEALERLGAFVYSDGREPTAVEVTRELRSVAAGARAELVSGAGLTETVMLAQIRSVLVDTLQVAGLAKISALATLPPTVASPAVTPDVYRDWPDDDRDPVDDSRDRPLGGPGPIG